MNRQVKRQTPEISPSQAVCDKFNAANRVGTAVKVRLDSGEVRETVTTAKAHALFGHIAVIYLKGITGCYELDRVTPSKAVA